MPDLSSELRRLSFQISRAASSTSDVNRVSAGASGASVPHRLWMVDQLPAPGQRVCHAITFLLQEMS